MTSIINEQINVSLSKHLKDKIHEVAKAHRMSRQWIYRDLLYFGLAKRYGVIINHDDEVETANKLKDDSIEE